MTPTRRRFIVRSIFTFLIAIGVASPATAQAPFTCTEVLGFSQSWEWFTGRSLQEYQGNVTVPDDVFLDRWQGRFEFGAAVELWIDPAYRGWEGTYLSPAMCPRADVDRIVFNVSGAARETEAWAGDITRVLGLLRQKYPGVRRIVLQPVVGAGPGQCGDVRAARNHPQIAEAISRVAEADATAQVVAGPSPVVTACDQYSDLLGHLAPAGAGQVHEALSRHYAE